MECPSYKGYKADKSDCHKSMTSAVKDNIICIPIAKYTRANCPLNPLLNLVSLTRPFTPTPHADYKVWISISFLPDSEEWIFSPMLSYSEVNSIQVRFHTSNNSMHSFVLQMTTAMKVYPNKTMTFFVMEAMCRKEILLLLYKQASKHSESKWLPRNLSTQLAI